MPRFWFLSTVLIPCFGTPSCFLSTPLCFLGTPQPSGRVQVFAEIQSILGCLTTSDVHGCSLLASRRPTSYRDVKCKGDWPTGWPKHSSHVYQTSSSPKIPFFIFNVLRRKIGSEWGGHDRHRPMIGSMIGSMIAFMMKSMIGLQRDIIISVAI